MIKMTKNGNKAWVTFTFSSTASVESVSLVGEWSQWKEEPMKRKKNGDYYITKVLPIGNNFEFGYKVNENEWMQEEECTSVPSPFTSLNSLLTL